MYQMDALFLSRKNLWNFDFILSKMSKKGLDLEYLVNKFNLKT